MPAYKEKDGSGWYCQFWYTDWTGKRRHSCRRGFGRKKEAEAYERDFKASIGPEETSMANLITAYKEHLDSLCELGSLKTNTADNYKATIDRHIATYFADVTDVALITPSRVNKWLATVSTTQYRDGGKPRSGTLRNIRSRLRQLFEFARQNYGLPDNPVDKAEHIKSDGRKNKRAKLWTIEQYQAFRDSLPRYGMKVFFDLLFFAGLRIGEAAVLTPACVQPYKLIVAHTYVRRTKLHDAHITTPKTLASRREVQIPRFLYQELQDYMEQLYEIKADDPLFNFTPEQARDVMYHRVRKLDLPYASPHTLRHSYASLLLNVTKDITVVSHQIGHANPKTTWAVYSHMVPGQDRAAVDQLEAHIQSPENLLSTKKS